MKKVLRFFKFLSFGILGLILITFFGGWVYVKMNQSSEDATLQAYLSRHQHPLNLGSDDPFAGAFDSLFYQHKIFLLGEIHGYQWPQTLDFQLLTHLHQQQQVRYYLSETDCGEAFFLNQYLQTGDEKHLKKVFSFWIDQAQWGNQEFYEKIRKIRTYNQSLPDSQRIRLLGVDRLQDLPLNADYLTILLDSLHYQKGSQPAFDRFLSLPLAKTNEKQIARQAREVLNDWEKNDSLPTGQYGKALRHLMRNFAYLEQKNRDSIMVKNLLAYRQDPNMAQEKLYGLWGYFHTLQAPLQNESGFACLLQQASSELQDKVASINILSMDGEMLLPAGMGPEDRKTTLINCNGPLVYVDGVKDLTAVTKVNSSTLFNLDGEASPYAKANKLAHMKALIGHSFSPLPGKATTDYFQYVILIRNSPPLTALRK